MSNFERTARVKEAVQALGMLAAVVGFVLFAWLVIYGSLSDNPWLAIPSRALKGGYGPVVFIMASLLVLLVLWVTWRIWTRSVKYFDDR